MLRNRKLLLLPLLCFLLAVPTVFGQAITYEDQLNLVAPTISGETGLFTTITADTLKKGDWSFGIYLNNYDYLAGPATSDMIIPSRRKHVDMDVDDTRLSASLGYGLTDRWEFAASIPYARIQNNAGDQSGFVKGYPYLGKFTDDGLGDLHLGTKFALLDPANSSSRLALSLFVDVPTGDDNTGISTGSADYGLGLHWTQKIFSLAGTYRNVGNRDADKTPFGESFDIADEFHLDAGVNLPLRFWSTTNWITEVNAIVYNGGDQRPDNPIYLVTGIRHWFGQSGWALNAAVRANASMLGSDSTGCPYGGLLGLTYAPMHLAAMVPPPPAPTPVPPPPPPPPGAPVTPPPEPVAPPHQPQELRTDEIHFESGSARLTNIAKAILDDVALRMKQEPTSTAVVIGYTDNKESTGAANDLDRRRAEAVRDYLVSRHGIDPSRITVEARDNQEPIGDNTTAEGRLKNRRVVIKLIIP
jgi:outer membrane protein OmpA-like peptidoglycan-associated protein